MTRQMDTVWAKLTEEEKSLRALKEARNEIFSAEVLLAVERLKGVSVFNMADIISSLMEIDKCLRREIVILERKIIEKK